MKQRWRRAVQALGLECTLRALGCEVLGPASSTAGALVLLGRERPNLVLLDLVLQDGSALPVAERLIAWEVPFALSTGQDGVLLEHPLLRGAPCLRKPYGSTESRQCLHALYQIDLKATPRLDRQTARVKGWITGAGESRPEPHQTCARDSFRCTPASTEATR